MDITNDILVRYNSNDPGAKEALFKAVYKDLKMLAYRITDNEGESEDIAITSLTRFFTKNLQFKAVEQLKFYLYVSVRHRAINYIKRNKKADPLNKQLQKDTDGSEKPAVDTKYDFEQVQKLVYAGLEKMEKQCAAVMRLDLEGMEPSEIAKKLNISQGQVYTQKSKAKTILKEFLKENGSKYGIPIAIILLALLCKLCFG